MKNCNITYSHKQMIQDYDKNTKCPNFILQVSILQFQLPKVQ